MEHFCLRSFEIGIFNVNCLHKRLNITMNFYLCVSIVVSNFHAFITFKPLSFSTVTFSNFRARFSNFPCVHCVRFQRLFLRENPGSFRYNTHVTCYVDTSITTRFIVPFARVVYLNLTTTTAAGSDRISSITPDKVILHNNHNNDISKGRPSPDKLLRPIVIQLQ